MLNFDDDEIEHVFIDNEVVAPEISGDNIRAINSSEEYAKLRKLIFTITAVAALLTFVRGIAVVRFLSDFTATFFIVFAGMKFVNIEHFIKNFRSFNLVARNIRPWAYVYPFVEILLGFWYLLSDAPQKLNVITATLAGVVLISSFVGSASIKRAKSSAANKYIRMPLMTVVIIENTILLIFALMNIILKL